LELLKNESKQTKSMVNLKFSFYVKMNLLF